MFVTLALIPRSFFQRQLTFQDIPNFQFDPIRITVTALAKQGSFSNGSFWFGECLLPQEFSSKFGAFFHAVMFVAVIPLHYYSCRLRRGLS